MALYRLGDDAPQLQPGAWVADSATVLGKVELHEGASVWYGAVVRGDTDRITIGRHSNVQDNSVLHTDAGIAMVIGEGVTVGHQVMLHGCSIGDFSLVGIQSVVLNGAKIGRHCLVGAGSLVTERKEFPDGSLIVGRPAVVKRPLSPEEIERLKMSAAHYVQNAARHRAGLERIG